MKIECMLYAGKNLEKARELFADGIKYCPRIRLTIRRRTRVLGQWSRRFVGPMRRLAVPHDHVAPSDASTQNNWMTPVVLCLIVLA